MSYQFECLKSLLGTTIMYFVLALHGSRLAFPYKTCAYKLTRRSERLSSRECFRFLFHFDNYLDRLALVSWRKRWHRPTSNHSQRP